MAQKLARKGADESFLLLERGYPYCVRQRNKDADEQSKGVFERKRGKKRAVCAVERSVRGIFRKNRTNCLLDKRKKSAESGEECFFRRKANVK